MKVDWGCRDEVTEFVSSELGFSRGFSDCQTAAIRDEDGSLVAGVVFHDWSPETEVIEISCAAQDARWCQRNVMQQVFGYVFHFCQMCVFRVHEDNKRTRRLIRAFGAKEHLIPRLRGRDANEIIMTLTDDDWAASKYLR